MRKTITLFIALLALTVSSWATTTTITWDAENGLTSIDVYSRNGSPATSSQSLEGITLTGTTSVTDDYAGFYTYNNSVYLSVSNGGTLTFSSSLYEIQSIVINFTSSGYATGWTNNGSTLTWTGSATHSVEMTNAYVNGITSIVFTVEAIPTTTVEWDGTDISTVSLSCSNVDEVQTASEIDGITASLTKISNGDNCQFSSSEIWFSNACGKVTFTSSVGNIISIVITCGIVWNHYDLSGGWTFNGEANTLTWEGTASNEVILSGGIDFMVSSIEFIIDASAPTPEPAQATVTWDSEDMNDLDLREYTHRWSSYQGKYIDYNDGEKVAERKDVVATISGSAEGAYAQFSTFDNNTTISLSDGGTLTFSSATRQFESIVINYTGESGYVNDDPYNPTGWNDDTQNVISWSGSATNSVVLESAYVPNIATIVFTFAAEEPTPAVTTTTITWDQTDVASLSLSPSNVDAVAKSEEIDGITASLTRTSAGQYDYCQINGNRNLWITNSCGYLTFTSTVGDISHIVITCEDNYSYHSISALSSDWTYDSEALTLTWDGTASDEVSLLANMDVMVSSIEFTVTSGSTSSDPVDPEPIPGPSFTWEQRQVNHVDLIGDYGGEPATAPVIKNIITSIARTSNGGNCYFGHWGNKGKLNIGNCGYLTFKSIVGDLRAIVITCSTVTTAEDLSTDWTYDDEAGTLTWVGEYASDEVSFSGNINIDISEIEFYYTSASAPRLGQSFYDAAYQKYEITGAQTAKVAQQQWLSHTLDIPASVEDGGVTYYITEIDDYAFQDDLELPNVMGGANIGRVGAHAFDGCLRMDEIDIESEVLDEIGEAAFRSCKLMQDIGFYTEQPPVLGANAFDDTRYLNHILVPQDNLAAYQAASGWSTYAAKINTTYSDPQVGEQFFYHNQTTTNIYAVLKTSPKEAKVLPYTAEVNAIYPITREGTLVIPEEAYYIHNMYTITGIGANAYKDSTRFTTVMMPQAVKLIEEGAFRNCTGVEKVYFLWDDPTTVTWADADQGLDFKTAASGNTKIFVPENRLAAYKAWAPAWASCMIGADILDVTASEDPNNNLRHYRTFYDSQADYLLPPSVWAHAGYVSGSDFILTPVAFDGEILPRGTAVVLESETPTYRLIPVGNDAPAYTGRNDLRGLDEAKAVSVLVDELGITADQVYVLNKQYKIGDDLRVGMGMYRYTGEYLGAHKAYMILDSSTPNPAPRYLFKHEEQAEGVENVQNNASCNKILRDGQLIIVKGDREYNAQGQTIK